MQSAMKAHKRLLRVSLIEYIRNMQQSSLYNYRAIYLLCLYQIVNQSVNCHNKAVSASRDECGLYAASTRSRVKLRVSRCLRGLRHAQEGRLCAGRAPA